MNSWKVHKDVSEMFAFMFQAYLECSDEIQAAIRDMVAIVNDPAATEDERDAAIATITEALFPNRHKSKAEVLV